MIYVEHQAYRVGQKVRILNIKDKGQKVADRDLNGKIGHLAHKFEETPFGCVGVWVEMKNEFGEQVNVRANLAYNEFEVLRGENK